MPYKIDTANKEITVVTFNGQTDLKENEQARDDIIKICQEKGINKILADWREANIDKNVAVADFHKFGSSWPKPFGAETYVVAVVLSKKNKDVHFGVDFSNSVARGEGLVSRMFWSVDDGIEWLREI